MIAKELVANLRSAGYAIDPAEWFLYMAAHAHEARLAGGQRLLDQGDFTAWLLELAQAFKQESARPQSFIPPQRRYDPTCPRCGHIHQGESECGELMGGGRICRCELEVPA